MTPDLRLLNERLSRIESRLVQLMLYVGMNPYGKNPEGGFLEAISEAEAGHSSEANTNAPSDAKGTDWAALDRPTYQRRSREYPIADAAPTETQTHKRT